MRALLAAGRRIALLVDLSIDCIDVSASFCISNLARTRMKCAVGGAANQAAALCPVLASSTTSPRISLGPIFQRAADMVLPLTVVMPNQE